MPPEARRPRTHICRAAGFSVGVPSAFLYQGGGRQRHWFSDGVLQTPRVCRRGRAAGKGSAGPTECIASRQPMVSTVWSRRRSGSSRSRQRSPADRQSGSTSIPGRFLGPRFHCHRTEPFHRSRGLPCGIAGVGDPAWIAPGTALAATARWARVCLGIDSYPPAERCQRPPNPVMVMPWTKKRWAKMKSTRMGASMIVLTANTISQRCTSKSLNILIPTARGNLSMVLR